MPIIPSRFYGRRPWAARANRHRPAPGALDELTWYTDGDGDADVSPAADERCDGIDDDCDGTADEPDATDAATWYADTDGDGHGDAAVSSPGCEAPTGSVALDDDCDDADATAFPGADEVCGGADEDCDGELDEADAVDAPTWFPDADTDGFGRRRARHAFSAPTRCASDARIRSSSPGLR